MTKLGAYGRATAVMGVAVLAANGGPHLNRQASYRGEAPRRRDAAAGFEQVLGRRARGRGSGPDAIRAVHRAHGRHVYGVV